MGTRSVTFIEEPWGSKFVACIYRQMDGYPDGMGLDIADFLKDYTIINGISGDASMWTHANGMGCLAAQFISHVKTEHGLGGIYMAHYTIAQLKKKWIDYGYRIWLNEYKEGTGIGQLMMECREVGYMNEHGKVGRRDKIIFSGTPENFIQWINDGEHLED